jgi:hypothetical protein
MKERGISGQRMRKEQEMVLKDMGRKDIRLR